MNANAANPHYEPTATVSSPVRKGDMLLIDISSKAAAGDRPVFADITWMAFCGTRKEIPEELAKVDPGLDLKGTLRPYQQVGVRWLYLLSKLGLGACLADDMGLGKTIQVLSLLLVLRRVQDGQRRPSLLVAPASLLANWQAEAARFTPSLRLFIAHPSAAEPAKLAAPRSARVWLLATGCCGVQFQRCRARRRRPHDRTRPHYEDLSAG